MHLSGSLVLRAQYLFHFAGAELQRLSMAHFGRPTHRVRSEISSIRSTAREAFRPLSRDARAVERDSRYLQISFLGSHGGGSLVSQVKSDKTSLPGRFVEALVRAPEAVQ